MVFVILGLIGIIIYFISKSNSQSNLSLNAPTFHLSAYETRRMRLFNLIMSFTEKELKIAYKKFHPTDAIILSDNIAITILDASKKHFQNHAYNLSNRFGLSYRETNDIIEEVFHSLSTKYLSDLIDRNL